MNDNDFLKLLHRNNFKPYFQNQLLSIKLEIHNSDDISKDSKEVKGVILLKPKFMMHNIPIQVTILGESQCILYDHNHQKQIPQQSTQYQDQTSFRIHETQHDIIEKRNQAQKNLHSTEFLSQTFHQHSMFQQKQHKQIFLEGKQTLFQTIGQNKQRIKLLESQNQYLYEFSFFLPNSLPSSINQPVFEGIHLFVNYKISAQIEINQNNFIIQDEQIKKQVISEVQKSASIQRKFTIKRRNSLSHEQTLCNKLIFKYFHTDGKQVDNQFIQQCCCLKYIYQKITKRSIKYDLYHCQILSSINQFKTLHLTARIFIQPSKDHLDKRKILKGNLYASSKKSQPHKKYKDGDLTISKIMDNNRQKQLTVKIQHILVIMYGEIIGVKKIKVFQKIITLNRQMYDICEGQMITQIPFQYFSQKNQLFQIKYWLEIQPLTNTQAQTKIKQKIKEKTKDKNNLENQFELTMSQLNERNQNKKSISNKLEQKSKQNVQKIYQPKVIEKISREINPIQF